MEIHRQPQPEMMVLRLVGRLDAAWSGHVGDAIAECVQTGHHALGIDMAGVDYISSAGIRVLLFHSRQLKEIEGRFVLLNTAGEVRRVLLLAGLDALLHETAPPRESAGSGERPSGGATALIIGKDGARAEAHDLDAGATMSAREIGDAECWLRGDGDPGSLEAADFGGGLMGVGLGALGGGEIRLGEFLAVSGAAIAQAADGTDRPDYVLEQGSLVPSVRVAYGILGRGSFAKLLRFEKGPESAGMPMSDLAAACLDLTGGTAAAIVMVAETAALVGAALQRAPVHDNRAGAGDGLFTFPGIREWLSFTAETAFPKSTTLVVGFVEREPRRSGMKYLRPMRPGDGLVGHFHAAAFPYRPIRRGRLDLIGAVLPLFDNENVLGVLHLMNDWRSPNGVGESLFLRGACWCSPVEVKT